MAYTILDTTNITGVATATSFVKSGGTSSQYLMADGSVTTSSGGSSPWSTDASGITYSAGNVGIGIGSNAGLKLYVDGDSRITGGGRFDGELRATFGLNLDDNAYLYDGSGNAGTYGQVLTKNLSGGTQWATPASAGVTQIVAGTNVTISPVSGVGAVTINSTASGGGGGTVTNVIGGVGIDVTNGTSTPNVYLDLNELTATYTTGGMKNDDAVAIVDNTLTKKVFVEDFRRLDTAPTINTASGTIISMTASASVTIGHAVCGSGTLLVKHANANNVPTLPAIGIALNTVTTGGTVDVLIHGVAYFSIFPSMSNGSQVFVDDVAGRLSNLAPQGAGDMVQVIGMCIGPDKVLINPSPDYMIRS